MTNIDKILLTFFIISITNFLGHYFPPTSIFLSPITIGCLTYLLITTDFKFVYRILLITFAIILNDIFIKKFAGGESDLEGAGFINVFLIIGLGDSLIIILIKIFSLSKINIKVKILFALMMPAIMVMYLQYFGLYGVSYTKSMNLTKQKAIENKTFLYDLNFSERDIIYCSDSIHIISGWTENELMVNHNTLIQNTQLTDNLNYKINLKHNLKPDDISIYYQVNNDDINGAQPIDSVLRFTANKSDAIKLTIFKLRNDSVNKDTIISRITIKAK